MDWKEFLKPTIGKVIIFILLIFLTIFIPKTTEICSMMLDGVSCGQTPAQGIGYPMFFGEKYMGDARYFGLYPLNLLINIVVYWLLSCGIVSLYNRSKKKK